MLNSCRWSVILILIACHSAHAFSGGADDYAVMLTSTDPQDVKAAAQLMFRKFNGNQRVNDIAAKRLWNALNNQDSLDADTTAWLVKAVGGSGSFRYETLMQHVKQQGSRKARSWAVHSLRRMALTSDAFDPARIDLHAIRTELKSRSGRLNAHLQQALRSGELRKILRAGERMFYIMPIVTSDTLSTAANVLEQSLTTTDRDMIEALAWLCRALYRSGNPLFKTTLDDAISKGPLTERKCTADVRPQ